ncbi:MAG TPA: type IX secretion system sortase PorU, partial [Bacteroidales bacterium]|nr:type IX secretion system sortase PorU [Bacteroidales bacterium]
MKGRILLLAMLFPFLPVTEAQNRAHSVLASGKWYRIGVTRTGIYRITYEDFTRMGWDPSLINPDDIRVYGNGGGMLSETTSDPRPDDLKEIAVQVTGSGDGHFDPGDMVLFYGESPDTWSLDNVKKLFKHTKNLYSDTTFYFITTDLGPGKRIVPRTSCDSLPSYYSRYLSDYAFHEEDSVSPSQTGKLWVGEVFDNVKSDYTFHFSFPHIDTISPVYLTTSVVAWAPVSSKFTVIGPGGVVDSVIVEPTDPNTFNIVGRDKMKNSLVFHAKESLDLEVRYDLPTSTSTGWLDYLELNCQRRLIWTGPQMPFRDVNNIGPGKVSEFVLQQITPEVTVWDVTHPDEVRQVLPYATDSSFRFRAVTDTLRQFMAFDGSSFDSVQLSGPVANQDLHGMTPPDLVIVVHPLFLGQAQTLADFHRQTSHLTVDIATTTEVYNEFSSGKLDPSAIRDFLRMLYQRGSSSGRPRYLLLFGDGSYDPKNRVPNNLDFIPTFQSANSLNTYSSYVTDDYFGILGDHEGYDAGGSLEIGVGRFPVNTPDEADVMVNKILQYADTSGSEMSDWKNVFTFVADDENNNLHLHQAESLVDIVQANYPVYNVRKIYVDAYPFESTPSGMRAPGVNQAIDEAVNQGTIILNYTGHGGETGWAEEKIMTFDDINTWNNQGKLPVFITATCEFSRFDNPIRVTGGEMILLRKQGGAIALYSTTRPAFASSNIRLDTSFFLHLISPPGQPNPCMGDLLRISKNNNDNMPSIRNFELLGDPAQQITFPKYQVVTTAINQQSDLSRPDTVLGLSTVNVTGQVQDIQGALLGGFNGVLQAKVFDKPVTYMTIGNTPGPNGNYPEAFTMQNRMLCDQKVSVTGGKFALNFTVPKDIDIRFGNGKISYYAHSGLEDANGFDTRVVIGGTDPSVNPENAGPDIRLYMDNTDFVS